MANKNRVFINKDNHTLRKKHLKEQLNSQESIDLKGLPDEFVALYQQRREHLNKIKQLKLRLKLGFSEPLHDYYNSLLKEDAQYLTKMLAYWLKDTRIHS